MANDFSDADVRSAVGFIPAGTTQMRFSEQEAEKFDRWLARVKREAAAAAWWEGARWAFEEITGEPENQFALAPGDNPHRKQVTE